MTDAAPLLHRAVTAWAARDPGAPLFVSDERSLSYGEVDALSARAGAALQALGVAQGDRVVLLYPNGIDYLLLWLAISRIGALFVPINTGHRGAVLRHQLHLAAPRLAIVGAEFLPAFAAAAADIERPPHLVTDAAEVPPSWAATTCAALWTGAARAADAALGPQDPAAIFFTSGTTGPSKGVLYGHGQAGATARPMADRLDRSDVLYWCNPMFHVALPHFIGATILAGGRVAVRPKFSVENFWPDVRRHGATATMLLGAVGGFLSGRPPRADDGDHPLRKVFMVPLLKDTLAFEARFGVRVMSWFNMTEVSTPLHTHGFARVDDRSCGRVRDGIEAQLVDALDRPVADGEPGELVLRSERPWEMSLGYWRNPEATVAATRNFWFHTGDLFTRDAVGNYTFADRVKDAIRRRGENISSFEIESEMNAHLDVVESAAVAVPSEHGEDEVMAVVVARPGSGLTEDALLAFLAPRVAPFMLPRFIRLTAEELPKTPTGKIQKQQLRAAGRDGAWDRDASSQR